MTRQRRLLIEILLPAPLGAIALTISNYSTQSFAEEVKAFPIFLAVVYAFALIPSLLYALTMELWFGGNFHRRLGVVVTTIVSLLAGLLAGGCIYLISLNYTKGSSVDMLRLAVIGAVVGIILGGYLAYRTRDKARP